MVIVGDIFHSPSAAWIIALSSRLDTWSTRDRRQAGTVRPLHIPSIVSRFRIGSCRMNSCPVNPSAWSWERLMDVANHKTGLWVIVEGSVGGRTAKRCTLHSVSHCGEHTDGAALSNQSGTIRSHYVVH